jgi:hypothetical protein
MNRFKSLVIITVFIPFFSDAVDKKEIEPKRAAPAANAAVVFSGSAVAAGAGISGLVFDKFSKKNHTNAQDRLALLQQQDMAAFTSARDAVRTVAQQANESVNSIRFNMQTLYAKLLEDIRKTFNGALPVDKQKALLALIFDDKRNEEIRNLIEPYTSPKQPGSYLNESDLGDRLAAFYRGVASDGSLNRYQEYKRNEATAVAHAAQCTTDLAAENVRSVPQIDHTHDAEYLTHLKHAQRWKYGMYLGIGCGIMAVLAAGLYAVHKYWLNSENTDYPAYAEQA